MNTAFIYLIIAEFIFILLIFLVRFLLNKQEHKKIDKILKFLQKNKDNNTNDKFKECLKIIEQNKNKEVKKQDVKSNN